jgi:hypothetical protein
VEKYESLPLHFEPNAGQAAAAVRYLTRVPGGAILFTDDAAVIRLARIDPDKKSANRSSRTAPPAVTEAVLKMKLVGGSQAERIEASNPLPGAGNYFLGADPQKWRTNVPLFAQLEYRQVYEGVDLIYYGNGRELEYDFRVAARADARVITVEFQGTKDRRLEQSGDLVLQTGAGELRLRKPVAYQQGENGRELVSCQFALLDDGRFGFHLGDYDHERALVIDPTLVYSSFLGGQTDLNFGHDVVVDSSGIYLAGDMLSVDFPTEFPIQASNKGKWDIFVAKLTPNGSQLVFSTYLGGTVWETPWGIAIDSARNVYIGGSTYSVNFPVVNAVQPARAGLTDTFVAKLNAAGNALVYSTYNGGSAQDYGNDIAVTASGEAFLTGYTNSTNFPKISPYQATLKGCSDAFITRFNPTGARTYSTYLGGSGCDISWSIDVDTAGNMHVTGETASINFPITPGAFEVNHRGQVDAFVSKLNAAGNALVFSTFLGGSANDYGRGIAVHSSGSAFVTGYSHSANFPTTAGVVQRPIRVAPDAFVARLAPTGQSLMYATFLGGKKQDYGYAIDVDGAGNAYVTGQTFSVNFPVAGGLQDSMSGPGSTVFSSANAGANWSSSDTQLDATFVEALSVDAANPAVIVAGTDLGIYRSSDGGASWNLANLTLPIGALVRVSSAKLLAAEQGNIWESTNGGVSWSKIGSVIAAAGEVRALAVDPINSAKVYAGTQTRGVFASTNGGATWTQKTTGMGLRPINALAIHPAQPQILYAGSANNGVYKSTDGGTNWAVKKTGLPTPPSITSLALDALHPETLYAAVKGCVYKTVNGATNWTWSGCLDAVSVAIVPSNPAELYAGSSSTGVYHSLDGGATWQPANTGIGNAPILALGVHPTNASNVVAGAALMGDAFIAKLNPTGTAFVYSTYLGGAGTDRGYSIAAGGSGETFVTGTTSSRDFPTTSGAFQRAYRTTQAFIAKIVDGNAPCTYQVNPSSRVFLAAGATLDVSVVSPGGCNWTASAGSAWVRFPAGNAGQGVGSFRIQVDGNAYGMRSTNVTIGGHALAITQAAAGCTFTVTPTSQNVPATANNKTLSVKAGAACPWEVDNPYSWITINSGATGTGNGSVALAISANTTKTKRTAQLFIGGKTVTINQPGI